MRARPILPVASACLCVVILAGCGRNSTPSQPGESPDRDDPGASQKAVADVGATLYSLAEPPIFPRPQRPESEPIVIPNCYVQYEDRQQVSAEVEGKIELIASPMTRQPDGKYVWNQDGTVTVYDPANPHPSIVFHPRDRLAFPNNKEKWVPYWRLTESDAVAADQIICLMDDQLVLTKKLAAEKVKEAALEVRKNAEYGVGKVKEKIALYKDNPDIIPASQRLDDLITLSRFNENLAQASQAIAKSEQEVAEAELVLSKHQIRSRVQGIVRSIAKRPGEFVRSGEKIFEIQSTEKVRLEGTLDRQYERHLHRNMTVTVEPAVPNAPVTGHSRHLNEVGGIAVSGHAGRPLVISAGLDGSVLVWDPNLGNAADRPALPHNLPHPVGVRSVACTPPGTPQLAITGANDGKVRIWDLADPARLPEEPKFVPHDFHTSAVTAMAASPDGKYAASAAGREVFIWNLAEGKRLYPLPAEHRDSVTSVSFNPQGQLITASKDRTLKVWKLGTAGAAVVRTIDHRSAVVDYLGISPDGGRVLFDRDKSRIDLVNISDGQAVGQLANAGTSAAFATLAIFAPDYLGGAVPVEQQMYNLVTAGGDGDLKGGLQVWQAPKGGGRASEIARLITPGRSPVTSAAFSPHKDAQFLVVGTADGPVHLWIPRSAPAPKHEGRVTLIDATDPRYVTVRVEMRQPEGTPLSDHSTGTVIAMPAKR